MDEIKLIELRLPSRDTTVKLSRELSAKIWDAVKRDKASSAAEWVNQALDRLMKQIEADNARGAESHTAANKPDLPIA